MSARDEILTTINQRLAGKRAPASPPPWQSERRYPDLGRQFLHAVHAAGGEAERAQTLDRAVAIIDALLVQTAARRIVANAAPSPMDAIDWKRQFPGCEWHIVGHSASNLREACAGADIGISSAAAALAETGTLVLHSGPERSRLATLLPPIHVAIVPQERLVTDLFAWQVSQADALPSNITLVSGPSKTADIEQTLAVGMHGPKRLVVILLGVDSGP